MKQFEFDINKQDPQPEFKKVQKSKFREMGIKGDAPVYVEKVEDLRRNPPNIIIAECLKTVGFIQNKFKPQELKKKQRYVMGLGVYKQLWYDNHRKKKILKPAPVKFHRIYRPYIGHDLTDKTLLVMRTGGIGDLLFIQPNLTYLKKKYPSCKIILASGPQYHAMLETWNCIDLLLDLPFNMGRMIDADYHAIFEGVIERCVEAATTNAYRLFSNWLGLNLPDELLRPKQPINEERLRQVKKFLEKNDVKEPFILTQLRASSPVRTPSPKFWTSLIESLIKKGHLIIITDAPHMHTQIDMFIKGIDPSLQNRVINFTKESQTLDYTIALTSLASCVLSPDSSLIHIAAAVDIPGFGIYGAFPGEIRLTTYENIEWVDGKMDCSPCLAHGTSPCRYTVNGTNSKCYETIDINKVVETVTRLMR